MTIDWAKYALMSSDAYNNVDSDGHLVASLRQTIDHLYHYTARLPSPSGSEGIAGGKNQFGEWDKPLHLLP
jgi:hypothetical protein